MKKKVKIKNKNLLGVWKQFQNCHVPSYMDVNSEKLSEAVADLDYIDTNLAGFIHTYIFYGKYSDERKNFNIQEGIKQEIQKLQKIKLKINKMKTPKKDSKILLEVINCIKELKRIATKISKEDDKILHSN